MSPFRFDQFTRCGCPGYFKGDSTPQETNSSADTNQTDQRVGASESGIALGAGAALDQSFTDASTVDLNVSDSSNRSVTDDHSFTDASTVTLNTSDNSSRVDDHSFTDASTVTLNTSDNRVYNTLDGELSGLAIVTGAQALKDAGNALEKQITAQNAAAQANAAAMQATVGDSLSAQTDQARINAGLIESTNTDAFGLAQTATSGAYDTAKTLAEATIDDAAAARKQQTEFLQAFYRDRESGDVKITGDLAKYATMAAIAGAIAWAIKG